MCRFIGTAPAGTVGRERHWKPARRQRRGERWEAGDYRTPEVTGYLLLVTRGPFGLMPGAIRRVRFSGRVFARYRETRPLKRTLRLSNSPDATQHSALSTQHSALVSILLPAAARASAGSPSRAPRPSSSPARPAGWARSAR